MLRIALKLVYITCGMQVLLTSTNVIVAQPVGQILDIRGYGVDIPPGEVTAGDDAVVHTRDRYGDHVLARVHVNVGANRVVLLPDGQLVARHQREAVLVDKAFEKADMVQLGKNLVEHEFPGFRVKRTVHYIYIYNTSESFATATSKILEMMTPGIIGYMKNLGLEVHQPEVPLVVVMFKTEEEFRRYRKIPNGMIAYYHTLTNRVVMHEESRLNSVKPDLAIKQKINTIAHEGVHQLLHNIGVQTRMSAWPMWITEGIAEYLSPTTTGRYMRWKGAGQVNDFRMMELEQFLQVSTRVTQSPGDWLTETILASRLDSQGYASAWALTHYLAKTRRTQFNAYIQELQKLGPLDGGYRVVGNGSVPKHRELYAKHFDADLAVTETRLRQYLPKLPYTDPFIDFPHVSAVIGFTVNGQFKKTGGVFHNPMLARQWVAKTIVELNLPADSVQTEMKSFENRILAQRYLRVKLQ
ncbi:MAG: DUF1570 domain-containing protein [Planctomycetaceae bacterium]|jgi:hypothetical protein|nr:DUF1570 domain-containing protein [Planctomycetaceae bacterium]